MEGNRRPSPVQRSNCPKMCAQDGLPVRRVDSGPKAPVVADSEIIDAWLKHDGKLRLGGALDVEESLLTRKGRLLKSKSDGRLCMTSPTQ
jgi:hypothetical protein